MNELLERLGDTCEYEGCPMWAAGWIEAQWSCVDFVRWDMCHDHLWQTYDELEKTTVEGQPVLELNVRYYG